MHTCTYTCTHTRTHTCTYTHMNTHAYTYIHTCMHACMHACIALHCIALHCIALHCIALHCIALHCIALHCIALHCIALHCIALHCIACIHTHIHTYTYIHTYICKMQRSWALFLRGGLEHEYCRGMIGIFQIRAGTQQFYILGLNHGTNAIPWQGSIKKKKRNHTGTHQLETAPSSLVVLLVC